MPEYAGPLVTVLGAVVYLVVSRLFLVLANRRDHPDPTPPSVEELVADARQERRDRNRAELAAFDSLLQEFDRRG